MSSRSSFGRLLVSKDMAVSNELLFLSVYLRSFALRRQSSTKISKRRRITLHGFLPCFVSKFAPVFLNRQNNLCYHHECRDSNDDLTFSQSHVC
ncbi:uncharacterized protein PHALS_14619 [Plasmopara halstedii]|uniref:Uncharacterized protein n=1 Tax=Plasmopara halstedii TaxID=4781 RepID=A0A0N7L3G1_PLAHL|nr:uncharacterized protein PHALS_14619 [Plasmopara halstedii]CEG35779.1 hypothetical protein PHALS_14619 [Plasmopara halstedii]|eukprot:XP_024572148.1 hypothetical protein PHALS_14619 [Plasmopara halstedii]